MKGRFTRRAVEAVQTAVATAEERGDGHIGTEHLLLGVLAVARSGAAGGRRRDAAPALAGVLDDLGVDVVDARAALAGQDADALAAVGIDLDAVARETGAVLDPVPSGRLDRRRGPRWRTHRPFTAGAQGALEGALTEAAALRDRHVGPEHLLLSLAAGTANDQAAALLRRLGVEPATLRGRLQQRLRTAS